MSKGKEQEVQNPKTPENLEKDEAKVEVPLVAPIEDEENPENEKDPEKIMENLQKTIGKMGTMVEKAFEKNEQEDKIEELGSGPDLNDRVFSEGP